MLTSPSPTPAQHYTNHSRYHPHCVQLLSLKETETAYETVHCTIPCSAAFVSARAPWHGSARQKEPNSALHPRDTSGNYLGHDKWTEPPARRATDTRVRASTQAPRGRLKDRRKRAEAKTRLLCWQYMSGLKESSSRSPLDVAANESPPATKNSTMTRKTHP